VSGRLHAPGLRRKAVTLIELLVAIAGLTVLSLVAYGVYDQTQAASLKIARRQAAIDYALLAMKELTLLLENAVAPANLDRPEAVRPEFKADRLAVPSYVEGASPGLYLVTVSPGEGSGEGAHLLRRESPVAGLTSGEAEQAPARPLGLRPEGFEPRVRFRYAVAPPRLGADVQVDYREELEAGLWPVLVEIVIRIELEDYPTNPVELRTAVIPGRLPSLAGTRETAATEIAARGARP